jgi:hypothetical protein
LIEIIESKEKGTIFMSYPNTLSPAQVQYLTQSLQINQDLPILAPSWTDSLIESSSVATICGLVGVAAASAAIFSLVPPAFAGLSVTFAGVTLTAISGCALLASITLAIVAAHIYHNIVLSNKTNKMIDATHRAAKPGWQIAVNAIKKNSQHPNWPRTLRMMERFSQFR